MKFVTLWQGPARGFGPPYEPFKGMEYSCRWLGVGLYGLDADGQAHALVEDVEQRYPNVPVLHWLPLKVEPLPGGAP